MSLSAEKIASFGFYAYFDEKAVEFHRGELAEYEHRSDESGRCIRVNFCPRAVSKSRIRRSSDPGLRAISAGTFDQPDWLHIQRHLWTRYGIATRRAAIIAAANKNRLPATYPYR
jgi:hypothetical protein